MFKFLKQFRGSNNNVNESEFVNESFVMNFKAGEDQYDSIYQEKCISVIVNALSNVNFKLYSESAGGDIKEVETDTNAMTLINEPFPNKTAVDLYSAFARNIKNYENFFALYYKDTNILQVLDTKQVKIKVSSGIIKGIEYNNKKFASNDTNTILIHYASPEFSQSWASDTGQNYIDVVGSNNKIDQLTELEKNFRNMIASKVSNVTAIGSVISFKDRMKKDSFDKFKQDIKSSYSGSSNAGKVLVTSGSDLSLNSLNNVNVIDGYDDGTKTLMREFLVYYGVPDILLGNLGTGYSAYYVASQSIDSFYDNSIIPLAKQFTDMFNSKILINIGGEENYILNFENPKPIDQEKISTIYGDLYSRGVITLNELRQKLGESDVTNGDVLLFGNERYDVTKETVPSDTRLRIKSTILKRKKLERDFNNLAKAVYQRAVKEKLRKEKEKENEDE